MSEELIDKHLEFRRSIVPPIVPDKAALLIIDMQEYQVRKDWAVYKSMNTVTPGVLDYYVDRVVEVAEPNIIRLAEVFRQNNLKIVYTMYSSFNKDGSDLPRQTRTLNERVKNALGEAIFPPIDHPGSKIIDSLKPREEDLVIIKNTSGVFAATNLEFLLKNMGIEQLIVVGVVTNMCVEGAARTGSELGFDVFLVDDACAAWSPQVHTHSLRSFEMIFGSVLDTGRVIERIKGSA